MPGSPRRKMARVSEPGQPRPSGCAGSLSGFVIGGCDVASPAGFRLFEPTALAVYFQNMDMMRKAIEQSAGETLALENTRRFLEWKIRRDDGRATLMTLTEDLEEELSASLGERCITEFIDDEELDSGELGLELEQTLLIARFRQLMNGAGRRNESNRETAPTGREAERQAGMRLAGPAVAQSNDGFAGERR